MTLQYEEKGPEFGGNIIDIIMPTIPRGLIKLLVSLWPPCPSTNTTVCHVQRYISYATTMGYEEVALSRPLDASCAS